MQGTVTVVKAENRGTIGTSASKKLRRIGKVPGVVYGSNSKPILIQLDHNQIAMSLDVEAFHSSILDLDLDGKSEKVLLREYQMHPYKRQVTHIDFQRVDEKKKIHTNVPLHFIGEEDCPAVKMAGGTISHILNDIEITCLPKNLPEFIEIDISELEIGNSMHVSQLKFPSGVEPVLHGQDDPVVVTAVKPKGSAGDDEDGVVDGKMVSSDEGDDSSEKSTDSDGGSSS